MTRGWREERVLLPQATLRCYFVFVDTLIPMLLSRNTKTSAAYGVAGI